MSESLHEEDPRARDPQPVDADHADVDAPGPSLPPTSVESLVNALLEAGPEVAEHVVRAAQELLLAAKVVVDAAEQAVREQQEIRDALERDDDTPSAPPRRHLDVAE